VGCTRRASPREAAVCGTHIDSVSWCVWTPRSGIVACVITADEASRSAQALARSSRVRSSRTSRLRPRVLDSSQRAGR
jgi:hypothetical protein